MNSFNTPVVLIIYKRSETLYLIIEELRKINASSVYVIADGPKNEAENEYTQKARSVIDTIEWDCKIKRIYSDQNLGLYNRVLSGLDEVFKYEENAIILEDDCIPNSSFFSFISQMLGKYNHNKKITLISGTNIGLTFPFKYDYDFSNYPLIWGWGTWNYSWYEFRKNHPLSINEASLDKIESLLQNKVAFFHWTKLFLKIETRKHFSWAHEMVFHLFISGKLAVIPKVNYVSNQGVDKHSTHTKSKSKLFYTASYESSGPYKHPKKIQTNLELNSIIEKNIFSGGIRNYLSYLIQKFLKTIT